MQRRQDLADIGAFVADGVERQSLDTAGVLRSLRLLNAS
jgi:hypothetical protein